MKNYVVVVGIIVTADSEAEAQDSVASVLEGDRNSGVIAEFRIDHIDEISRGGVR